MEQVDVEASGPGQAPKLDTPAPYERRGGRAPVGDAEVVARFYAAVAARDMDAAASCFAPDAHWHLPGTSPIAGDHVGWAAIRDDFILTLLRLSEGTFRAELLDIAVGATYVVAVQHATAHARGKVLDLTGCQLMRIESGLIQQVDGHYSDEASLDNFWRD